MTTIRQQIEGRWAERRAEAERQQREREQEAERRQQEREQEIARQVREFQADVRTLLSPEEIAELDLGWAVEQWLGGPWYPCHCYFTLGRQTWALRRFRTGQWDLWHRDVVNGEARLSPARRLGFERGETRALLVDYLAERN